MKLKGDIVTDDLGDELEPPKPTELKKSILAFELIVMTLAPLKHETRGRVIRAAAKFCELGL